MGIVHVLNLAGQDNPVCRATVKIIMKELKNSPYGYVVKMGAETQSERGLYEYGGNNGL